MDLNDASFGTNNLNFNYKNYFIMVIYLFFEF